MTRVCLVGADDAILPEDLLASPNARDALDAYYVEEPFENAIAVEYLAPGRAIHLVGHRYVGEDLNDWFRVDLGYTGESEIQTSPELDTTTVRSS